MIKPFSSKTLALVFVLGGNMIIANLHSAESVEKNYTVLFSLNRVSYESFQKLSETAKRLSDSTSVNFQVTQFVVNGAKVICLYSVARKLRIYSLDGSFISETDLSDLKGPGFINSIFSNESELLLARVGSYKPCPILRFDLDGKYLGEYPQDITLKGGNIFFYKNKFWDLETGQYVGLNGEVFEGGAKFDFSKITSNRIIKFTGFHLDQTSFTVGGEQSFQDATFLGYSQQKAYLLIGESATGPLETRDPNRWWVATFDHNGKIGNLVRTAPSVTRPRIYLTDDGKIYQLSVADDKLIFCKFR